MAVELGTRAAPSHAHAAWQALLCVMLAACGGGGPPATSASGLAAAANANANASAAAPVGPVSQVFSLPQSYTRGASFTFGSASSSGPSPVDGSRGRLFDLNGDFMATDGAPTTEPRAVLIGTGLAIEASSTASGVTPNGIGIGWKVDREIDDNRGFVFFRSTGLTQFLPAHTYAEFVAETGVVAGHLCDPRGAECHAFHWNPTSQALVEHPNFQAAWMNNLGTLLGQYQPPGEPSRLATADPDGTISPLPAFVPAAGVSATPLYIDDTGAVFINTSAETGAPPGDAVVIAKGEAKTIGRGIARRPDICGICNCVETTAFRAFSATGHAVGVDSLLYLDKDGWHVAAEAGFHWSASEGTKAIRLGEADAIPTAVNSQGLVVGAISSDDEPFIWQAQAGGQRLRPLLYPDTHPGDFPILMRGIGDAGHLLAITLDFQRADGVTLTSFFPD